MNHWDEFEGGTRRAPRFPLEFPLSYRTADEAVWHEGRGANISRSGLLFHAQAPLQVRGWVEVRFPVPIQIPGRAAATVVCRGHVARQVDQPRTGVLVASTIESYRFRPGGS